MSQFVVGQKVHMASGVYGCDGTVVKVAPWGVEVHSATEGVLFFDNSGKACTRDGRPYVTDGTSDSAGNPTVGGQYKPDPWSWAKWGIPGTYECGPWHIVSEQREE